MAFSSFRRHEFCYFYYLSPIFCGLEKEKTVIINNQLPFMHNLLLMIHHIENIYPVGYPHNLSSKTQSQYKRASLLSQLEVISSRKYNDENNF